MGVINCSPEFIKNSTPGLDMAHPRRVINSSPAFFKHEGLEK
jgi:hypothetical protein